MILNKHPKGNALHNQEIIPIANLKNNNPDLQIRVRN